MGNFIQTYETTAEYNTAEPNLVLPNVSLTNDDMEVHYNKWVDPYNGHAYVDLGLPSGTKWATMNVGATSETDRGLYFAWGETQGYTADQVGSGEGKRYFGLPDYKYTNDNGATYTKYNNIDGKSTLDSVDDAATVNFGGKWHTPTDVQIYELFDNSNCTTTWTTMNDILGILFTSVRNGNTLFIPTSGYATNGEINRLNNLYIQINFRDTMFYNVGESCCQNSWYDGQMLSHMCGPINRCVGLPVRGVIG